MRALMYSIFPSVHGDWWYQICVVFSSAGATKKIFASGITFCSEVFHLCVSKTIVVVVPMRMLAVYTRSVICCPSTHTHAGPTVLYLLSGNPSWDESESGIAVAEFCSDTSHSFELIQAVPYMLIQFFFFGICFDKIHSLCIDISHSLCFDIIFLSVDVSHSFCNDTSHSICVDTFPLYWYMSFLRYWYIPTVLIQVLPSVLV